MFWVSVTSWQSLVTHPAQWGHSCFLREDLSAWRWLASSSPACLHDPLSFLLTKALIHIISWKPSWREKESWRNNCISQGIWPPNIWLSPTPLGQPMPGKSLLTLKVRYGFKIFLLFPSFLPAVWGTIGRGQIWVCRNRSVYGASPYFCFYKCKEQNCFGLGGMVYVDKAFFILKGTPANFTYCSLWSLFLLLTFWFTEAAPVQNNNGTCWCWFSDLWKVCSENNICSIWFFLSPVWLPQNQSVVCGSGPTAVAAGRSCLIILHQGSEI